MKKEKCLFSHCPLNGDKGWEAGALLLVDLTSATAWSQERCWQQERRVGGPAVAPPLQQPQEVPHFLPRPSPAS